MTLRIFELEELGVPSQDRLEANPQYWLERAIEAKKRIDSGDTYQTSGDNSDDNLYYVHSSNSALKRTSVLWIPCWEHGFQIGCPNLNWGWNAGTTTTAYWFIPSSGTMSFGSDICNDRDIGHDTINYDMRIQRSVTSVTLGTSVYDYDQTTSEHLDADRRDCDNNPKHVSIPAGTRADLSTSISNISVPG